MNQGAPSLAIVGAIVALVAIGGIVVTLVSTLSSGDAGIWISPFITTLLGLIGTVVVSLLALIRIEQTRHDINNGVLKDQVKTAMIERAKEYAETGEDDRE